MERRFIQISGIRLSYLEKNPDKSETIFLIHHNCGSAQVWRKQLASPLFNAYRLIAFDLPGHGQTDVLEDDQDYFNFLVLSRTLAQAIKQLITSNRYILVGVSLGTNVVAEMLCEDLEPVGMILAGPSTVGKTECTISQMMKPGSEASVLYMDEADLTAVKRYAGQILLSRDPEDQEIILADYLAVRKTLRPKIGECIATGNYNDEIALLEKQNSPLLVVFGEEDYIVNTDYLDTAALPLWQNKIFKIPRAGHLVNVDQPKAFNELMADFAQEILH
ncbi:alpha/beta fold hydrolase [Adhaeribacter radiodurans]|uniref:Alpha/beta hydrolase n=1 Tax=Adhaeribacter radiodurans TaxID=2745197 RepID=A0A7L7LCI7_9BACT|nr:alpha/beta hydrolase [Adhaeribacter radiodurans]QMU30531.1 alpha/beta hydrolase [Adhaeribacter radiodurans]